MKFKSWDEMERSLAGISPEAMQQLKEQFIKEGQETANKPKSKAVETLKQVKEQRSSNAQEMLDYKQQFIKSITPMAVKAGAELNVDPKLIIAQAALETGYGKSGGNNLFGIKSSHGTPTQTHEEINGRLVSMQQNFAAYDSKQASFDDYVRLMKTDRYSNALANGYNPKEYFSSQHKAGYQTDSLAPSKLLSIYNSKNISGLDIESGSIAKTSTSMGIGAALAGVISGGTSKQIIPSLKMAANDNKIPNTKPTSNLNAYKIPEKKQSKYDETNLKNSIKSMAFQDKVLFFLKRIDKNIETGIGGNGKSETMDKNGNIKLSSGNGILGAIAGSLAAGLLGNTAGNIVGGAVGGVTAGATTILATTLKAAITSPLTIPILGLTAGVKVLSDGISQNKAIREAKTPEEKAKLTAIKDSSFFTKDLGKTAAENLTYANMKKLPAKAAAENLKLPKPSDTMMPKTGNGLLGRIGDFFSKTVIPYEKKNFSDPLNFTSNPIFDSANKFKSMAGNVSNNIVQTITPEWSKTFARDMAADMVTALLNALRSIGNGVISPASSSEIPYKALPVVEARASTAIIKPIATPTLEKLTTVSSVADSIIQKEHDRQNSTAPIIQNITNNNVSGGGSGDSIRLSPRIPDTLHQKISFGGGVFYNNRR